MPHISEAQRKRMMNAYHHDLAIHLAKLASEGRKITYGDVAEKFGGTARGWGDPLGGIAIRCHDKGLPLLPVLVVAKDTGKPSLDAILYEDLGLKTAEDIEAEQQKCWAFNWSATPLWR